MQSKVTVRSFGAPKAGNTREEYEDGLAVSEAGSFPLRAAVADGATGASFSGVWARLLCEAYVFEELSNTATLFQEALPGIGRRWRDEVTQAPLPWYAQEKMRAGTFAAFCGVTIEGGGRWQAIAVGDCCLLHRRATGELVTGFPIKHPNDFSINPTLIGAFPAANVGLEGYVRTVEGIVLQGDTLYLMTDALAAWALRTYAAGRPPWPWLEGLFHQSSEMLLQPVGSAPVDPLAVLRETHGLANDDVTLVAVTWKQAEA